MKKAILFILAINYLLSMKAINGVLDKQNSSTQEGTYLSQHTQIFPNPIQDYFYVESTDGINIKSFIIYDITGKQVMLLNNDTNSTIDIDTSTYNSGMYLLQIASKDAVVFKKIIIKN